jgi:hypothetical protein
MPGLAHPVNIGTHGNPNAPDSISDITFSNIDILTHNPLAGVGCISLTASDENLVSDIVFTDIRWEDVLVHKFIDIITYRNPGYSTAPGRGINGVLIRNFSFSGDVTASNQIYGNSTTRLTQNIFFENLRINGNLVSSASQGNFTIGAHTRNINYVSMGEVYNRLKSYNFPDRYIRHSNFVGRIDQNITPVDDSKWKIVPGLADAGCISFESVNYPGYYLRHSNYELVLNRDDGSELFKNDATFKIVDGLADSNMYSFQSYNYPNRYIRHSNNILYLQTVSTSLDRSDATFDIVH